MLACSKIHFDITNIKEESIQISGQQREMAEQGYRIL